MKTINLGLKMCIAIILCIIISQVFIYKSNAETSIEQLATEAESASSAFFSHRRGEEFPFITGTVVHGSDKWVCIGVDYLDGIEAEYNRMAQSILDIDADRYSISASDSGSGKTNQIMNKMAYYMRHMVKQDVFRCLVYRDPDTKKSPFYAGGVNQSAVSALLAFTRSNAWLEHNNLGDYESMGEANSLIANEYSIKLENWSNDDGSAPEITKEDACMIYEVNGTSYLGPISIDSSSQLTDVTIDGSNSGFLGLSRTKGGNKEKLEDITVEDLNSGEWYAVFEGTISKSKVTLKVSTVNIFNPIKGRLIVLFKGNSDGQAELIFGAKDLPQEKYGKVSLGVEIWKPGDLELHKIGEYNGIEDYEEVSNYGFRVYNQDEGRYLRVNNSSSTSSKIVKVNEYDLVSSGSATIFYTTGSGSGSNAPYVRISGLPEADYRVEEVGQRGEDNYSTNIIDVTGYKQEIDGSGNAIGGKLNLSFNENKTRGEISNVFVEAAHRSTLEITDYRNEADITINKVDSDVTSTGLSNVTFRIQNQDTGRWVQASGGTGNYTVTGYTTSESSGTIFKTSSSGTIRIRDLDVGPYTVYELENPNYGYYDPENDTNYNNDSTETTINVTTSSSNFYIENTKYTGNLEIIKRDMDSGVPLRGVEFKIKVNDIQYSSDDSGAPGKYLVVDNRSSITGTYRVPDSATGSDHISFTTNANSATTFITDANGLVRLNNILIGSYEVEEIYVGSDNDKYYDAEDDTYIFWSTNGGSSRTPLTSGPMSITVDRESSSATSSTSSSTSSSTINVYNRQKWVTVTGYVWDDMPTGKDGTYNNLYNEFGTMYNGGDGQYQSTDTLLNGINVTIRDKNSDSIISDKDGKQMNANTSGDGSYLFDYVEIDSLDNYFIQFEYDGLIYTSTEALTREDNGSKALERIDDRDAEDAKYDEITANKAGGQDKGYVRDDQKEITYDIVNDPSTDATATYQTTKEANYGTGRTSNAIQSGQNGADFEYNKVRADTRESDYYVRGHQTINDIRGVSSGKNIYVLENRNCGLRQREQVDLSIASDLENVEFAVHGYTHTYKYGASANTDLFPNINDFRIAVKANTTFGYQRPLYESDLSYQGADSAKMWITYKVVVANNSSTVAANVTEVANYYDSRYEIDPAEGFRVWSDTGDLPYANQSKYGSTYSQGGYNSLYVSGLGTLDPGQSQTYYITYKLSQDALDKVLENKDASEEERNALLNNVVEISAYNTQYSSQTFYHTGTGSRNGQYASIDKDSAPENSQIDNRATYEDDTAMAPTLTVSLTAENRALKGTVFRDAQTKESADNNERLGDGIYNSGEDGKVENVKVELIEMENGQIQKDENGNDKIAKRYYYDGGKQSADAETTTDANGNYSIEGLIPDEYILKYTYSDDSVVYLADGTQEGNIAVNDYKATIITSDVIKQALNNNNEVVRDPDVEPTTQITYNGVTYDADKWHIIREKTETEPKETIRYSDAMDENSMIDYSNDDSEPINNGRYEWVSDDKLAFDGIVSKQAYTGAINVQIEYDAKEKVTEENKTNTSTEINVRQDFSDGTYVIIGEVLTATADNVDFGIIEKPEKDYDLKKEIVNIKLTLANGQILIEGDPRNDNLDYVKYLDYAEVPYNRPTGQDVDSTVNMEVDSELIYGSTLEITYAITGTNKSETNYLTYDYYKYGIPGTRDDLETLTFSQILDYLDNELVYNAEGADPNRVSVVENLEELEKYFEKGKDGEDSAIFKNVKEFAQVISLTSNNELVPEDYKGERREGDTSQDNWGFKAQKLLSTSDDLEFRNDTEIVEIEAPPAPPKGMTLGNYDPTTYQVFEADNANAELIITPPTGANKTHIITIVAITASALLAGGIVLIKRKFFKNK